MITEIKLAENAITKDVLISLGVNADQICVANMPICKIGSGVYPAKAYSFESLDEFKDSDLFNDTLNAGVFVIYEQKTKVDLGIEFKSETQVPNYILRIFG